MHSFNDFAPFLFVLLVIGIIEFFVVGHHKDLIRESLEAKKARVIRITWMPLDFDRSNHTYYVEYESSKGKQVSKQCKIHFWGSTIYWEE